MKRFIEGADRSQNTLFPERLDDYIFDDNPVRIVDVFVDELDLAALGFSGADPESTGRPSYHPATLLKLYIYGYLNRIQSSRRLERETQRNVELMWLTGQLSPDFKTIADFRRDNGLAIQKVCSHFIRLCREAKLFIEAVAAVDGSKFKAVNNSDRAFTARKLQVLQEQLEESIGRYLVELDRADREPTAVTEERVTHIQKRIQTIKARVRELDGIRVQMEASPDGQIALTDPDARCMASRGRDTPMVGYNVQTAVDTQHHLIVAHEVTNIGNDRAQLAPMSQKAREAMGCDTDAAFTALADRGHFSGEQILECAQAGITALVPKSMTSNNRARGLFDKRDFRYQPDSDSFQCPAGQQAIRRFETIEHGRKMIKYWSSACPRCPIKSSCTTSDYRRITRWEHEEVLDAMQQRLDDTPDAMRVRRRAVEHPYATLKSWMGATHFLTKMRPRVSTEMSLHVLAYNMKRVMKILGPNKTMQMIGA